MTPLREFLLAFADDEHLMGQQHTEWIGVAPFLEEDLAFASIGQDELGHAVLLYELVCELDGVEPTDEAIDALAFGRSAAEYRSCELVEYATTDWAEALVRHWIYDTAEQLHWQLVENSSYQPLADLAARVEREESYHRRHADALLDELLASDASRVVLLDALRVISPMVGGLLSPIADVAELENAGVRASASTARASIETSIGERFGVAFDLGDLGVRGTHRSADFAPLMARMREVLDLDLTATW